MSEYEKWAKLKATIAAQAEEIEQLVKGIGKVNDACVKKTRNAKAKLAAKAEEIEGLKEIIRCAMGGIEVFVKDIEAVKQTLEQALAGEQKP